MGKYKISDLENLTGIKSHTIRIWEQRYKILSPLRTDSNIRYYDDQQLLKLLNVVSLIKAGNKISAIGKLTDGELREQVESLVERGEPNIKEEVLINQMISSGLTYDENLFQKTFSISILNFGLMNTYQKVLYPMMIKIGFLWTISKINPSQEHFVSNLIRQKIFSAIDAIKQPLNQNEKWLLFLPEDEQHDLGLLIANYGLRMKGKRVTYLGPNVPLENIISVSNEVEPCHYLTFVVKSNQHKSINKFLTKMKKEFNNPSIHICCSDELAKNLELSPNQKSICSFERFQEVINN